jgi:hypothetical protein
MDYRRHVRGFYVVLYVCVSDGSLEVALHMNPPPLVTARGGDFAVIFCIQSLGKLDKAIS